MKKSISFIVIFFCALAFATCDKKVTRAIPAVSPCEFKDMSIVTVKSNAGSSDLNVRKVLLEDYTGQFCGNCPKAAREAERLEPIYGSKLIVMASHVTDIYAKPKLPPDTLYTRDYMNDASTAWDNTLLISKTPGLPGSAVDRSQPWSVPLSSWQTRIDAALQETQNAKLVITTYYDTLHGVLKVKVLTTFLKPFSDVINVVVAVTEDGIIGIQKDYAPPAGAATIDGEARPDYVFNNLVLGSANGPIGQLVKAAPAAGDTATVATPCYTVRKCFYDPPYDVCKSSVNDNNVHAVVFVYNASTQEVLQVEKIKIK